ncbi:CHAP domain-containing protein [Gordonia sp. CPCC 205333]|uniref:CHAP domain-containing protein n=1 Tax=Gordonia sp. CPCC 205333 TaxID=3140790 RepID=UPI003AF358D1
MSTRRRRFGWQGSALVMILVVGLGVIGWRAIARNTDLADRALAGLGIEESFPDVDVTGLSPTRKNIVEITRHEYEHKQPGEYYAQGNTESWCADFVSWTMRKAGAPLNNPNSGSWRIPGVSTLTEYYQSVGRFRGSSYRPRTGDVVLYEAPNRFKQHTNIVLRVDGDTVTTVGGNEPPSSISINSFDMTTVKGIVGYGVVGQ